MILSNDGLVAFHYRSYGTFFLQQNRLHNIHRDLPTTNIIEPFFVCFGAFWGQNLNELIPEQIFQILANSICVAEIIQMKLIIVK